MSIEPDSWLAYLISRSIQEWRAGKYASSNVQVLCASISDSNRVSQLTIAERARAANYLVDAAGSTEAQGTRYIQPTVTLTLDFLLEYFPHPSVLKIDVETHETSVLMGAKRLLNEVRPTIWCEVSPQNSEDVTKILHAAGYDLSGAQTRPHQRTNRAWFHTLAVPRAS